MRLREEGARDWEITFDGFDPEREPLREALCTLANGYLGTRGAAEEVTAGGVHYPGTYLAGGYDRIESTVAGEHVENEELVNWPSWLPLSFRADEGPWLHPSRLELLDFHRRLDLARGLLRRRLVVRDAAGRETEILSSRLVHRADPHRAAQHWQLIPRNWSGRVVLRSGLDGAVANTQVRRYRQTSGRHLRVPAVGCCDEEGVFLVADTLQSRIRMGQAARTRVDDGERARRTLHGAASVMEEIEVEVERGRPLTLEKVVCIHTSRDQAAGDPVDAAKRDLAVAPDWDRLVRSHEVAWRGLWRRCDLELEVDDEPDVQRDLRLLIFHVLQSVPLQAPDVDAGVPARGLHGEAYRGHVFWDELFVTRFLELRLPEVTRELLMYRFDRLTEARRRAASAGLSGACFPWRSASDGREVTPRFQYNERSGRWLRDDTRLQRHVNAAIAFDVWQYVEASGDRAFMELYGAEMLVQIARTFASLAQERDDGRYSIPGVVGPDEFHTRYPGAEEPGIDDNAYTNVMASWCLAHAARALEELPAERRRDLRERLDLADGELRHWQEVRHRLHVPVYEGVISQFAGYEMLEEIDLDALRRRHGEDAARLDLLLEASGDDVNRYQASKQADLLMLFYLLPAAELEASFADLGVPFGREDIRRHVSHYLPRTTHGSTLSFVVHAWVQARLDRGASWLFFERALRVDRHPDRTTHEGLHLAAMSGALDIVQRNYAGLTLGDDALWINPHLPDRVRRLRFPACWRRRALEIDVDREVCTVTVSPSAEGSLPVGFGGEVHALAPGEKRSFALDRRESR